ncbi:MAG TPA: excinuclease ABC subunit A, partial [Bacteroidales bacterium]|nr:excinuclease ABC subunit A [Bacteroidales bacterium]
MIQSKHIPASPKDSIIIKGARVHNLKNISLAIPRNKFVVITGLSGSGKSSLAFDTLYAEGQRRYVESLSAYARQFLGRMSKPEVESIKGIAPAIAIEQRVYSRNPRSTVGTSTEVYEYIKLLFARIGKTYSPVSGKLVKRDTVSEVTDFILELPLNTQVYLMTEILLKHNRSLESQLTILMQQGFSRVLKGDEIVRIEDFLKQLPDETNDLKLLVDRITIHHDDEDLKQRVADSVQTAFYEGEGECFCRFETTDGKVKTESFSNRFEVD